MFCFSKQKPCQKGKVDFSYYFCVDQKVLDRNRGSKISSIIVLFPNVMISLVYGRWRSNSGRRSKIPPYRPLCGAIISDYGRKSRHIGHGGEPKNHRRYSPWCRHGRYL